RDRDDARAFRRLPRDRQRPPPELRTARPPQRDALADVTALRIFFIGGLISYRGLFNWIHPAMYIPTMLVGPIFQILFFAYLGRYSRLESDSFFVVGHAVQISAIAGVFASSHAIANEPSHQHLF